MLPVCIKKNSPGARHVCRYLIANTIPTSVSPRSVSTLVCRDCARSLAALARLPSSPVPFFSLERPTHARTHAQGLFFLPPHDKRLYCRPTSFYLSLSILPLFCLPRAFSWLFNPRKRLRLRVKLPFTSEDKKKRKRKGALVLSVCAPRPPPPTPALVFLSLFYTHHCPSPSLWHLPVRPGPSDCPRG